ncbi:prolyl oligopeptidase family serine peptidase [Pseudoduganella ginsengisoli]|uniref:Prolyl oligopeptidase family serine peptidase n=1 Tax=Pseudoduganella ginsengisoli TaxID=1462440 RepID=A0A6L6Q684_9BURK|nr:prolyl oligopeptidase family serine peptidase [Pseudoduganella ginsengisoli]MTW04781.1 prolyl oligopeptidase family serine peptidase [Pseudoduganella ginsengisoli]
MTPTRTRGLAAAAALLLCAAAQAEAPSPAPALNTDPYLWLEDVSSERALDWVRQWNDLTTSRLGALPGFQQTSKAIREIVDSRERIPFVEKQGKYVYNFWKDAGHPRGVLRRTTLERYKSSAPKWDTVLDVDRLARDEKENWVWHGMNCLKPKAERCLFSLTRGGGDAHVVREFDTGRLQFVSGGFALPEAKSDVNWVSRDRLLVATDFGPGSLTSSGYPRIVKEWKRGTPLQAASVVFEGQPADISASGYADEYPGVNREFILQSTSFFTNDMYYRHAGKLVKLDKPNSATAFTFRDQLLIRLRADWNTGGKTYLQGSLLAIGFDGFMAGKRDFNVLYEPDATRSLQSVTATKSAIVLNEMVNVRSQVHEWRMQDGKWERRTVSTPPYASVSISPVDYLESDSYFMVLNDFLTPTSLHLGQVGTDLRQPLKSQPAFFDASGLKVEQQFATARDGTRIPYFAVMRKDVKFDGNNPTLLYGYGGFEISMRPTYNATVGRAWLEKGGVYVLSNIRGGGEFGPRWHEAALKEKRQVSYDDFITVAEDLIARKVTSPQHLGIMGGSLGGMLVSVAALQRPELFNAVVSQVPLADMKRYHLMLAGASWIDEYGDPDRPDEWAYISRYSPYHLLDKNRSYPPVFFTSSTRDDRVHPAHARKMVARMQEQGHQVLYWENMDGGHGGAVNGEQQAKLYGMVYSFLWDRLK